MTQRISYAPFDALDEGMRAELVRCAELGTPRPESQAVRANAPRAFWAFANSWQALFREGECDHGIKELCRVYISRTVACEFCGNQRSQQATREGLVETQYDDLLNFETSTAYDDRQKSALRYAQAIAWGQASVDVDEMWRALHEHFSEAQLVELGNFIALTFGQQSWIRLLGIDHHQYLAGTAAALAPGFETAAALERSKGDAAYWARTPGS